VRNGHGNATSDVEHVHIVHNVKHVVNNAFLDHLSDLVDKGVDDTTEEDDGVYVVLALHLAVVHF
jgi:hypothetical protein